MRYLRIVAPALPMLCCAFLAARAAAPTPVQVPVQPPAETGEALVPAPPATEGLPARVANLAAVAALRRHNPPAFEYFRKRFASASAGVNDVEVMAAARWALRKSVKKLLAVSPGDLVIDITEVSLAYMQGLQAGDPESCVAVSDETKGARLRSDLARDMPTAFAREMSVLESVAGTDPRAAIAPMSAAAAQPYFDRVIAAMLQRQPVRTELQHRDRLAPWEFRPYCELVIAFYQAVLELPHDDKVDLLRHLYATAAANADADLAP